MSKSDKPSFDALTDEQKQAAKWGLFMFIGCFSAAAVSMVALFGYMAWAGPRLNRTIAIAWFVATCAATTIGFNSISGRLRRVMGDSQSNVTSASFAQDSD
jgi:hypothetical protein